MDLFLYNSLTKKKEKFVPIDASHVKIYACGPTVYNHIHIGNARSAVCADILYKTLCNLFPRVTYARNLTDVDNKIINAALEEKISAQEISEKYIRHFKEITKLLFCDEPSFEPRATDHIEDMLAMIDKLVNLGYAYISGNEVFFDVSKFKDYGKLSDTRTENAELGHRSIVATQKRNEHDFVLWKNIPKNSNEICWDSKWGKGRPGWHIECSAMAQKYLGSTFDIHCGGMDLKFPHHENEIAQSRCANSTKSFSNFWVHNGLLQVDNSKMSKSLGNFILAKDLVETTRDGEILRYAFLSARYGSILNWNNDSIVVAKTSLNRFYNLFFLRETLFKQALELDFNIDLCGTDFINAILDDLNTPLAISIMHGILSSINSNLGCAQKIQALLTKLVMCGRFLGIFNHSVSEWFYNKSDFSFIDSLIERRQAARIERDYVTSDQIREKLISIGVEVLDKPDGTTSWRFGK